VARGSPFTAARRMGAYTLNSCPHTPQSTSRLFIVSGI